MWMDLKLWEEAVSLKGYTGILQSPVTQNVGSFGSGVAEGTIN